MIVFCPEPACVDVGKNDWFYNLSPYHRKLKDQIKNVIREIWFQYDFLVTPMEALPGVLDKKAKVSSSY